MTGDKSEICCFTGHRKLPQHKIKRIVKRLDQEIDNLIEKNVTDFISGGALGFDQNAASLIIAKRQMASSGIMSKTRKLAYLASFRGKPPRALSIENSLADIPISKAVFVRSWCYRFFQPTAFIRFCLKKSGCSRLLVQPCVTAIFCIIRKPANGERLQ